MNIKTKMQEIINSKATRYGIRIIGALFVLLLVFKAGEYVGIKKASFSYNWGNNYYRNFMGRGRMNIGGFHGEDFLMGHGVGGPILKNSSSTLIIQDRDGAEKIVLISGNTLIKRFRDDISGSDLKPGEWVVVLGNPNEEGQIEAKLVRVLPPPPQPISTSTSAQ